MKFAPVVTGLVTALVAAAPLPAQGIQGDAWRLGRFESSFGPSAWSYSPTTNLFLSALRREKVVTPVRLPPPPPMMVQATTRGPQDIAAAAANNPPPPAADPDPILPTTTVPEPATMGLLATGLLLLGTVPWLRRRSAR